MLDLSFWGLALSGAFVSYFTGHQTSNVAYSEVDPRVKVPYPIAVLYAIYSWLWFASVIAAIWYGFRVGWLMALAVVAVGTVINLLLHVAEHRIGLHHNAWIIGYVGLPLVPLFIAAMFFFVFQAHRG